MMKSKVLLMALMFLPMAMGAQGLEFRYQGQAVEDNATVTILSEEDSWGFGEMNCETNPASDPKNGLVLVTPSGNQEGSAVLTIQSNTLGAKLIQWCMGGTCTPMINTTQLDKTFTSDADGVVLVQFDANNIQQEGSLTAQLKATVGSDTRTVNIQFVHTTGTGITKLTRNVSQGVCYRLDGTRQSGRPMQKGIYVINGKKVVR
jgi:hypothetical protein